MREPKNQMLGTMEPLLMQLSVKQLLTKYCIFTKLPQIPYIHISRNFFKVHLQLFRPTASSL